ncbi:hypothetical protein Tco_0183820 [Tanacetum coccineum]
MADSSAIHVVDPVPIAGDTEAFETGESAPTPRPPQIRIPFAQTRLRRARKTIRLEPPMSSIHRAPLGYRAAGIRMRAAAASPPLSLLPTSPRTDVPEAEMPPQKKAFLTTSAPGYEIGEIHRRGACRQPRPTHRLTPWDEQRTEEFEVRFEEARDDRAYLGALVNSLYRDRPYHRHTALAIDREAVYARIA